MLPCLPAFADGPRRRGNVSKNTLTLCTVQMYNLCCRTDAELLRGNPACDRSSRTKIHGKIVAGRQPKVDAGLHQTPRRGRAARRRTEPGASSQIHPYLARNAPARGRVQLAVPLRHAESRAGLPDPQGPPAPPALASGPCIAGRNRSQSCGRATRCEGCGEGRSRGQRNCSADQSIAAKRRRRVAARKSRGSLDLPQSRAAGPRRAGNTRQVVSPAAAPARVPLARIPAAGSAGVRLTERRLRRVVRSSPAFRSRKSRACSHCFRSLQ